MKNMINVDTTRSISITQQIEIPDFTSAVSMTMKELAEYASRQENASAIIDKMFNLKIDAMRQWLQNLLQPFFDMPMEKFKEVFKGSVCNPIRGSYRHIDNNCFYKISFCPQTYGSKAFSVHLEIDTTDYVEFVFKEDSHTMMVKYPKDMKSRPTFFQGWPHYKFLAKQALQDFLNHTIKEKEKEIENQELMADFLSMFAI